MNNIEVYEGSPITFENKDGRMMVNATQMAQHFGKKPADWLRTQPSKEYISEFAEASHICEADLVQVQNGNGTWMHEDVALCFAQWLSPKFYIWCNQRIKELLKEGHTEMTPKTKRELYLALAAQEEELERLALENKAKQTYIEKNEENVQFAKQCAVSTTSISMEEFAKELYKKHNFRLGKNQCYKWFRDKGYLRDNNLPYQQFLNRGWFEVQKTQSWRKDGTCFTFPLVYIKDVAQQMFFYEILNDFRNEQKNGLF